MSTFKKKDKKLAENTEKWLNKREVYQCYFCTEEFKENLEFFKHLLEHLEKK